MKLQKLMGFRKCNHSGSLLLIVQVRQQEIRYIIDYQFYIYY